MRIIVLVTIEDMTVGRGVGTRIIYQIQSFHLLDDIFLLILPVEADRTARAALTIHL